MIRLFVFGLGFAARAVAARLDLAPSKPCRKREGRYVGTTRDGRGGTIRFDDRAAVLAGLATATHVLSSVPPDEDGRDPVLDAYGSAIAAGWVGYLSSTGVYGDAAGAWVDETAPTGTGRRVARSAADAAWLARGAHVFRLPGIYGPGRSPLDRVREGRAHRVDVPNLFSRIHVEDLADGVIAAFDAPPGAYNLADDRPSSQNDVIDFAARLIGVLPPPLVPVDSLSPMARGFYAEDRRIANGKAKRVLGWCPRYPDYRAGLRALNAMTSPMPVSTAPAAASSDQR